MAPIPFSAAPGSTARLETIDSTRSMRAYNKDKSGDMQKLDIQTHRGPQSNVSGTTRARIVPLTNDSGPRCVCCLAFAGPRFLLAHSEVNSLKYVSGLVSNLDVPCALGIGGD